MDEDIPDDYYELLGVSRSASLKEIKAAYRKEAKRWHPDVNNGKEERFRALNKAYETLSDKTAREEYDKSQEEPATGPYLTPSEIIWTVDGSRRPPEPVTVRLSNRGGSEAISQFGPEQQNGTFWVIEDSEVVMTGDDLYDFVVVPVYTESMRTDRDEVRFFIDDQTVSLSIVLNVIGTGPKPLPGAAPSTGRGARPAPGWPPAMSPSGMSPSGVSLLRPLQLLITLIVTLAQGIGMLLAGFLAFTGYLAAVAAGLLAAAFIALQLLALLFTGHFA